MSEFHEEGFIALIHRLLTVEVECLLSVGSAQVVLGDTSIWSNEAFFAHEPLEVLSFSICPESRLSPSRPQASLHHIGGLRFHICGGTSNILPTVRDCEILTGIIPMP